MSPFIIFQFSQLYHFISIRFIIVTLFYFWRSANTFVEHYLYDWSVLCLIRVPLIHIIIWTISQWYWYHEPCDIKQFMLHLKWLKKKLVVHKVTRILIHLPLIQFIYWRNCQKNYLLIICWYECPNKNVFRNVLFMFVMLKSKNVM